MPDLDVIANEFDKPWKLALEKYLRAFLGLCFPAVHDLIDWRHAPEFLDSELQQLGPQHEQGTRAVDRLVKVRLLDGCDEWLFIHIEVQAQRQGQFPQRMWTYYYRIWDKHAQCVVSLAVLADDDPNWRPRAYETETAGCRLLFEFPAFKVLDLHDAEGVFERAGNPFALVIAAHQMALATKGDPAARSERRFRFLRYLVEHGLDRRQARELWRVIYLLTHLPRNLELKFKTKAARLEHMSIKEFITPLEEMGMEEALHQSVLDAAEARFGALPEDLRARVEQITDLDRLRQIHRLAVTTPTLDEFLTKL